MKRERLLSDLHEGESAVVSSLLSQGSMRRRMLDIGLVCGTNVKCLQRGPGGDPTAYAIRGAVIALRSEDSGDIIVN